MGWFDKLRGKDVRTSKPALSHLDEVDAALEHALAEVARFRKELAGALEDERGLARELKECLLGVDEAERGARKAMDRGDQDAARAAVGLKIEHEERAAAARARLEKHGRVVSELRETLRLTAQKLDDAKQRRNVLVARQAGARTKQAIAEKLGGADGKDRFGDWEREISGTEREARLALDLLSDLGAAPEPSEDRRYSDAARDKRIAQELAELRKRGASPPAEDPGTG
ncbi:MAG: PspA/IM30 family protein [Acidobacteriota bacterium]